MTNAFARMAAIQREDKRAQLRDRFSVGKHFGKPAGVPRYKRYGVYDHYTGELVRKFKTRTRAIAFKDSSPDPHRMRVRGIPRKKAAK